MVELTTEKLIAPWNRYGPTRARAPQAVEPRLHCSPSVDIHAHVQVKEASDFVRPYMDWSKIPLAHFADQQTREIAAMQDASRSAYMSEIDLRLSSMDAMGVDIQVISPSPFQCYYTLPTDIGVQATRLVNDGIAAHVRQRPDRLIPLGAVPLQDGAAAAAELRRCVHSLGFKGVEILTNVNGMELSDPSLTEFWQTAEELDVLVMIHPNGYTEGNRLRRFYFNNLIGNPLDTSVALHYLIFDGVLEAFPKLKILAVHGGGFVGAYSARMDHGWGARSDCHGDLPHPPSSYLKRIFFDTVVFSSAQLRYLIEVFGEDHIVMGTDYAFDMAESDPIGHVRSLENIGRSSFEKIVGGNALKLLGLSDLVYQSDSIKRNDFDQSHELSL